MSTATHRRVKIATHAPDFYQALIALDAQSTTGLDPLLVNLVRIRASQLNGCAYCLDMHTIDARHEGDSEQRLYLLSAWREARKFYSEKEQAALELTEAITLISVDHVPDDVYEIAANAFEEKELAQLIGLIITINAWTRVGVTGRMEPGHYNPS
ncbi:AhpD family alkylhydroperoxidase [Kribbella orskensis]|uniref:AhpD family alkylhydroperoxidase n=1 Tax=Kribbella orskensis TaxID=2512216 RepID=A0ABY2BK03_9ACTN|nr:MULTISPECIES: carboxymuconolactone decarboxylase family protein [Kribbella]TCN38262.1 AhpD family alkylhydroperoxidase [Kribbella sp. VKM Ac-2500]TCO20208.1 AhpD family alkylhydroperoxidase [Kribbella orskensis]